jgi:hypothetical protein
VPTPEPADRGRIQRAFGGFLALSLVIWCTAFAVHHQLPYIRPGFRLVNEAKRQWVAEGELFGGQAAERVVILGDSRVLAGFDPAVFDARSDGLVTSCNLGLGADQFSPQTLEALCRRGQVPTVVLLTRPLPVATHHGPTLFDPVPDDPLVMETLFPFRDLPRNAVLFLARSRRQGGVVAFYRGAQESTAGMIAARGYYFIRGQSHYPNHQLPEGFSLPTDTPEAPFRRDVLETSAGYLEDLERLAAEFGFRVYFVPPPYRLGLYAEPAPVNQETVEALERFPHIDVLGPDCWRYPNRLLSDQTHLNEVGARSYTAQLWELVAPALEAPDAAAPE